MKRSAAFAALLATCPAIVQAETCMLDFTVEITRGVGPFAPGTELPGSAEFTASGQSFVQEGGAVAHLAQGEMILNDTIRGPIWTLISTSRGHAADLIAVHARDVEGFSFAGSDFHGPMVLTLFGDPGVHEHAEAPVNEADWLSLDVRRTLSLHAPGDMLAGDITEFNVNCG